MFRAFVLDWDMKGLHFANGTKVRKKMEADMNFMYEYNKVEAEAE